MDNYTGLSHEAQNTLLDAQRASGQTVRAFCFERGIKESRFYSWRTRRRRADLALAAINFLYHVDAHCRRRSRTPQQRLALRRRLSLPAYEALLDWVIYAQAVRFPFSATAS